MTAIADAMRACLSVLDPMRVDIRDDSARHAAHAATHKGGGHFSMTIVSRHFAGKRMMERHRMVYDALGALMQRDIHALSIEAKTPEET